MTAGQLGPLVHLRWRMVRRRPARVGMVVAAGASLGLIVAAAVVPPLLPNRHAGGILVLLPTIYAGFALLAFAAPIAAGGGNELYPADQLVAFPVTARTHYLSGLLLAPLNLAWFTQCGVLMAATGFGLHTPHPRLALALGIVTVYIALVTLLGQAVAWFLVGVRQTATGRRAVWAVAACLVGIVAVIIGAHLTLTVLNHLPTFWVASGAIAAYGGRTVRWLVPLSVMLALCWASLRVGVAACAWALRRTGDAGVAKEGRPLPRRAAPTSSAAALAAVDRASVWRSQALRRGAYVLALLPAAVAAFAHLQWSSLVLLPGLVAAGAGLLFGVNAFCLDAGGAVWVSSLPVAPRLVFAAKARVLAEVVLATVVVALVAGISRTSTAPDLTAVVGVVGGAAACSTWVVAACMDWSVRKPHRADLRGSRDTPAPPGAMAVYSARLAIATTFIGLIVATLVTVGQPVAVAAWSLAVVAVALRRLLRARRRYCDDPMTRARVVATVAAG